MALERLGKRFVPLVARGVTGLFEALPAGAAKDRALELGQDPAALERLADYLDALVDWNQRTDLTAARSVEELVDLFIVDALLLAATEAATDLTAPTTDSRAAWVDVGTGAGAPGLVVGLLRNDVRITLVEPKDRRVAFMRTMIGKFSLSHVSVERGRSDRLAASRWDVATSRATLPPADWLKEGTRLSSGAVWVLLAKDEAPQRGGLRIDTDITYPWPLTSVTRRAVRYVRARND